jgi:hypothetical protein
MLQTNNQKYSKQEKQTIISLLLIGLFIVLVAYMNNPNESTFSPTVKTEIK